MVGARREQFGHAPGARSHIENPAQQFGAQQLGQRGFNRAVGDMQAAQRIPGGGVAREIILRRHFARGADGIEMLAILGRLRGKPDVFLLGRRQHARQRNAQHAAPFDPQAAFANGGAQENPAAFAAPLGQPCVTKDLDGARHARLALTEHLRQLANRQFHAGEQAHDAQTRGIGQRA